MPLLHPATAAPPPLDPEDWRPQKFGRGSRALKDAIFEPGWTGLRVLARVGPGGTTLVDEDGIDATDDFPEVVGAIGAAALADDLVLDGYLTLEATQTTVGATQLMPRAPSAPEAMTHLLIGTRRPRLEKRDRPLDVDRPIAFVAVDLLVVDGTTLLDVPLLERKRLLDGALRVGELVRITPYTHGQVGPYISTWRSLGFTEMACKGANSHYLPGDRNDAWSSVPLPNR
jgi:bifunctional non-homologous end joining protein LigD